MFQQKAEIFTFFGLSGTHKFDPGHLQMSCHWTGWTINLKINDIPA